MPDLQAFSNDYDTYVAHSAEDARKQCIEDHMLDDDEVEATDFKPLNPDDKLKIWDDETLQTSKTFTVREWIERNGRGFLCSTEF